MNESSRDPVYQAELAHDTSGVNAEPFMKQALDSVVDDLLTTGKARGLRWQLMDFLADVEDLPELVAASRISGDSETMWALIEGRLRKDLEDSDAVHDLAAELASEPDEQP